MTLFVMALSGCQAATPTVPPANDLSLVPASGGLDVAGSGGREIGFGRDRIGVLESVTRVEGRRPRSVSCLFGRDAFETASGLRLVFAGNTFVGWESPAGKAGRGCA